MPRKKMIDPAAEPLSGKRYALHFRTTHELRDKLGIAAEASGRSLAQEAELRLEQSFSSAELTVSVAKVVADKMEAFTVDFLANSVGGEHLFMSGIYFAMLIHFFEEHTGLAATDPAAADRLKYWLDCIPELLRLPNGMPAKLADMTGVAAFRVAMIAPYEEPSRAEIDAGEALLAKAEAEGRLTSEKGFPVDEMKDAKRRIVAEAVSPPQPVKPKARRGKRPLSEIIGR